MSEEHGTVGELEALLAFLKGARGFDFSGYKRASLERRIQKRIDAVGAGAGAEGYRDYQDYLEVNPDEFTALFDTILINVTSFFRDEGAWEYLSSKVIPDLLETVPASDPIRVWSAGCSSGEEAYTVAMLFAEALGQKAFKERVKIYATDVDEDALATARQATYGRDAVKTIPDELLERYFESTPGGYVFRPDLRRQVIFGRNDLVQDAPISRIDLLVSRNTLMYFTAETQAQILNHLNFSLSEQGYLFLGRSEMLITHTDLFTPHELKWRVFRKVPRSTVRERMAFVAEHAAGRDTGRHLELRSAALETMPIAELVVDRSGFLVTANAEARQLLRVGAAELGRPLADLELSYRPVELRSVIDDAYTEGVRQRLPHTKWSTEDGEYQLEVQVTPLLAGTSEPVGVSVTFEDVTRMAELDARHTASKHELERAHDELQSTVEELETTNEELHSTNEELETTNEELQSTNEELETMNEELQSSNDELETMNEDQRTHTTEMDRLNVFLEGILGGLGVGVAVVDENMLVQVWNEPAADLWGLRAGEVVGENFLGLDIGLPVAQLDDPVRRAMSASPAPAELEVDALTRRGRQVRCWVKIQPLGSATGEVRGAVVLMADGPDQTAPFARDGSPAD